MNSASCIRRLVPVDVAIKLSVYFVHVLRL